MKIRHLFEYADATIEDFLSDEFVEEVKNNSTKFINEFLKNDIIVYRGNDHLISDEAHVIPTMPYREVHGNIFANDLFQTSLEKYLEDHNIPSRYQHAVSTIAFHPEGFDGVGVETWYYFIPKGNYRYHYYSTVKNGDINVDNPMFQDLAHVSYSMNQIYRMIIGLENDKTYIFNNVDKIFKDRDEKFVSHLFTMIENIGSIFRHPMEITDKDVQLLNRIVDEADDELQVEFGEGDSIDIHIFKETFDIFSDLKELVDEDFHWTIEGFKESIVVDEITDSIKGSELVFQCEEYYAIPMNDEGKEFLGRIIR